MKKPTITACVITKNESAHLPQWLRCVRQLTDDLVLVDTGSTDDTVALAKAAGAKVYHFDWIDDFAAAKNYALDRATGDWIVFLDADEYFSDDDCKTILAVVRDYHANPRKVAIITPLLNLDANGRVKSRDGSGQVRIFRNDPRIRYSGAIHEALRNRSGRQLEMQLRSDIRLYHTGYTETAQPEKMRRNLEILQRLTDTESVTYKIRDYYMAECYLQLGEPRKALAAAESAIANPNAPIGWRHRPFLHAISAMTTLDYSDDDIEAMVARAEAAVPNFPDFRFYAARSAWGRRHYLRAKRYIDEGLAIRESARHLDLSQDPDAVFRCSSYDPTAEAFWYLGKLAQWHGDLDRACSHFVDALRIDRYNAAILKNLCSLLQSAPPSDVVLLLNSLYDKTSDARFLAASIIDTNQPQVALYYNRQAGGNALPEVKQYWAAGHGEALGAATVDEGTAIVSLARYLLAHGVNLDPALWQLMPDMDDAEAARQSHYEQSLKQVNGQ